MNSFPTFGCKYHQINAKVPVTDPVTRDHMAYANLMNSPTLFMTMLILGIQILVT